MCIGIDLVIFKSCYLLCAFCKRALHRQNLNRKFRTKISDLVLIIKLLELLTMLMFMVIFFSWHSKFINVANISEITLFRSQ
jgi:hypothetical protein